MATAVAEKDEQLHATQERLKRQLQEQLQRAEAEMEVRLLAGQWGLSSSSRMPLRTACQLPCTLATAACCITCVQLPSPSLHSQATVAAAVERKDAELAALRKQLEAAQAAAEVCQSWRVLGDGGSSRTCPYQLLLLGVLACPYKGPLSQLCHAHCPFFPQAAATAAAAAAAGASAASEGEHAALAQRCKDLEKKFAVARKKIQVPVEWGNAACLLVGDSMPCLVQPNTCLQMTFFAF